MQAKADTSKFRHLWSMPGLSNVSCTRKELKAFLLETGGEVLANGRLWNVASEHLGAGVYRVKLARQGDE